MTWLLLALYFTDYTVDHVRDIATFSSVDLCRSALEWTEQHSASTQQVGYVCVPILGGERE